MENSEMSSKHTEQIELQLKFGVKKRLLTTLLQDRMNFQVCSSPRGCESCPAVGPKCPAVSQHTSKTFKLPKALGA